MTALPMLRRLRPWYACVSPSAWQDFETGYRVRGHVAPDVRAVAQKCRMAVFASLYNRGR
jgi:hypothetical protein